MLTDIKNSVNLCVKRDEFLRHVSSTSPAAISTQGHIKQRNQKAVDLFLRKHPDIPDLESLIVYHDYSHLTLEKLHQFTVYLWDSQVQLNESWVLPRHKQAFDTGLASNNIDVS